MGLSLLANLLGQAPDVIACMPTFQSLLTDRVHQEDCTKAVCYEIEHPWNIDAAEIHLHISMTQLSMLRRGHSNDTIATCFRQKFLTYDALHELRPFGVSAVLGLQSFFYSGPCQQQSSGLRPDTLHKLGDVGDYFKPACGYPLYQSARLCAPPHCNLHAASAVFGRQ